MALTTQNLGRLHANLLAANILIESVNTNGEVIPAILQTAAQPIIDFFDTSDAAQTSWNTTQFAQREPILQSLLNQAATATATNDTFLALVAPTNAQTLAQVKALTQQNSKIIQVLNRILSVASQ